MSVLVLLAPLLLWHAPVLLAAAAGNHSSAQAPLRFPPWGPTPVPTFDFYVAAFFWPPSTVPLDAQGRARHIVHMKQAAPGMWTHGLWPSK